MPGKMLGTNSCLVGSPATKIKGFCPDEAILVLGLFYSNIDFSPDDEAVLRLCHLVVNGFAARPDSQFLHRSYVYKSTIKTWMFGRAGAESRQSFELVEEPYRGYRR